MSVTIVTPTTGNKYLSKCIKSVQQQDYPNLVHLIIIDGKEFIEKTYDILDDEDISKVKTVIHKLPWNTGANGYVGHRIYAMASFLVETDYIAYLDEDNEIEPNHISSLMDTLTSNKYDWVYSMRKLIDNSSNVICEDNTESTGPYKSPLNLPYSLVDTSCYLMKKQVALLHGYVQSINKPIQDRLLFEELSSDKNLKFGCSKQYTLLYRTSKENVIKLVQVGNTLTKVPLWERKSIYLAHFSLIPTFDALSRMDNNDRVFEQWQLTLVDGLRLFFDIKNLYNEETKVPAGSIVLFHMCFPDKIPIHILKRTDITKVLYTIESPNIRHADQWKRQFIGIFDVVITYWKDYKPAHPKQKVFYHPFSHRLNFHNDGYKRYLMSCDPSTKNGKCCIVLNNRPIPETKYTIDDVSLTSLDNKRESLVEMVSKVVPVDAYGSGWTTRDNITAKGSDPRSTLDIIKDYTFCIVSENTDAKGYVSEKVYDVLCAGTIPLYYGELDTFPEHTYINISKYTADELQQLLSSLDTKLYLDAIQQYRESLLQSVSVDTYGKFVHETLKSL